jgi:hypothetical protein
MRNALPEIIGAAILVAVAIWGVPMLRRSARQLHRWIKKKLSK